MITVEINESETIEIESIVFDFNGTLAEDGLLNKEIKKRLEKLSEKVDIFILTADTFGKVKEQVEDIPCKLEIISKEQQDLAKLNFVEELGLNYTATVGNGRNDVEMVKYSVLGIGVLQSEGIAVDLIKSADIVCKSIEDVLDLFDKPLRLKATLRR